MPLPHRFIAFIHSKRMDRHAKALSDAYPGLWNTRLVPVSTPPPAKPPHRPGIDGLKILATLKAHQPMVTAACLFVIDLRAEDVADIRETFDYEFPVVEVVTTGHGDLAEALRPHLEYFGVLPSARPVDVDDALAMFLERHGDVIALNRAVSAAKDAGAFREPRLVLGSLHLLYRVVVAWHDAKRRDHARARKQRALHQNTWQALTHLVGHVNFDVSDSAAQKAFEWICEDTVKRDFSMHLKWNLGGAFTVANFCRVHWNAEVAKDAPPILRIGHCGEHL